VGFALTRPVPNGRAGPASYYAFVKGLAEYRLGRFDDAISLMKGEAANATYLGPCPRLVAAMALHRKGQKEQALKALAAAVVSYDWGAAKADSRDPWIIHVLRREAEAMVLPNLPAFLEGKHQPRSNDERLALLGACQFKGRRAAAAGLYAAAFAADPQLAEDQPGRAPLQRRPRALEKLPPAERQECRALWSDLQARLR
jgi:serine/threonine-protein kinase